MSATSSDPSVIPHPTVSYTSPNAVGSLSYTPVANASGTATITVTITDDGGTTNGGLNTISRTFEATVTPINDAPIATSQGLTVAEDGAVVVTLAATDVDSPSGSRTFAIAGAPAHGSLSAISGNQVTYTPRSTTMAATRSRSRRPTTALRR